MKVPCEHCDTLVQWGGLCEPCSEKAEAQAMRWRMIERVDSVAGDKAAPSWARELAEVLRYVLERPEQ